MQLSGLLGITRGVTAFIGSGGKTSLLRYLARELPGTVLLCTSTHIFPYDDLPLLTSPSQEELSAAFSHERVICAGVLEPETGKLTALPYALTGLADFVLCEADGSRGLPLKAHAPYEPVIPPETVRTVQVMGLSGLGKSIREAAHRSARYAALCGAEESAPVTPELAAAVLLAENLADIYYLNQAEENMDAARELAARLGRPCVAGSIREEWFRCLY